MRLKKICFFYFLNIAILFTGCVHQKNVNVTPVIDDKNTVKEAGIVVVLTKIEYTNDDVLTEYTEYSYNEEGQITCEIFYNRKGNLKESRFFEYRSGKISKQLIKSRKNIVKESREYIYSNNVLEEKIVRKRENHVDEKYNYIYTDGLLTIENIVIYNEDGGVSGEYYYLYFYNGDRLVRREEYIKSEPADELKEIRNYIYNKSKLVKEEAVDADGNKTKYFLYKYGNIRFHMNLVSGQELYDEVFSDDFFHEFIIEISKEEWDGITQDMLEYAEKFPVRLLYTGDGRPYRTGNYRKADLIYRRPDGEEICIDEIGIRTRGNESRRLPVANGRYRKTHFKIKFDETFNMDKNIFEYTQRKNRRFAGMKALNFKWSRYNPYEPYPNKTKINELFSYELLGKAGVIVPKMSLATLKFRIDGKEVDYGIYGIVEHVDKEFLKKRFGRDNDGDLYKCLYLGAGPHLTPESISGNNIGVKDFETNYRPIYDLKTNQKKSDHSELKDFIRKLNSFTDEKFVEYINKNFEVDKFIRFLAIGIYINNLDDYRFLANNYYLYFKNNGKIVFIPYDYDISLGTAWHGDMSYDNFINQDIFNPTSIPESWGDYAGRPLVDKILGVEKFRKKYIAYLKEFIDPANKIFLFSKYRDKFDKLYSLYKGKDINDTADKDPMGWHGYEADYFYDKTKNVLDQLGIPYDDYEVE